MGHFSTVYRAADDAGAAWAIKVLERTKYDPSTMLRDVDGEVSQKNRRAAPPVSA